MGNLRWRYSLGFGVGGGLERGGFGITMREKGEGSWREDE